ncbi:MAG: phenylacetaldoxime dehydratase family protein [Hyphomicrobiales bacterium]|nr:phenylacetaldoxime dehydratase family protein [Hyphomicrobiales bacterium]MCP5002157.1 phenylacetaldoxime dehydratase family protein [Hyphomicrobiales bacterium]
MQQNNSQEARRYPLRMPPGWNPPVPAWKSVFDGKTDAVSMFVIGCQHSAETDVSGFLQDLKTIGGDADIIDFATCTDRNGLQQSVGILYWCNPEDAANWLDTDGFVSFWAKHTDPSAGYGVFREMMNIPLERSETLFSGPEHDHGMSQCRTSIEGPIDRHMYWGGMRDRIPLSASDALEAGGPLRIVERSENRLVVEAHENLCIIRSGQDWTFTQGAQREEYLEQIEPVLKAGMEFLRDQGDEVSCYTYRYMRDLDAEFEPAQRSFGLAYFRTMKDLEDWAKHHPTHLAIFNKFLEIAPKYRPDLQLQFWHEVSVLPSGNQIAEYVNCSPGTGLLGGLTVEAAGGG